MGFEVFLDKFESFVGVNFWTMIFAWINLLILYVDRYIVYELD